MEKLPPEMLEKILLLLPPVERLKCALISRSLAQTLSSSVFLDDVWLLICGTKMNALMPRVIESKRQYRNLRIFAADLTRVNPEFWTSIGRHLWRLELVKSFFTPHALYSIIRSCPKLKSLEFTGYSKMHTSYETLLKPSGNEDVRPFAVRAALRNVRYFGFDFTPSEEALDHLLGLMPNATCISIRYNRFHSTPRLFPCLFKANRMITKLDIFAPHFAEQNIMRLVEMYSGCLQELRLRNKVRSRDSYSAIAECAKLRLLNLYASRGFGDDILEKLARNAPDLYSLTLRSCTSLTNAGLRHLRVLCRLRYLRLYECGNLTRHALRGLASIPSLQNLDFRHPCFDITVPQSITSLKDLRVLKLHKGVTSEGFQIICENFQRLEVLAIGDCRQLTDADGVGFSQLKNLRELSIGVAHRFGDLTFVNGLQPLALEHLSIRSCPVTDVGLICINAHHGRLRTLKLFNCRWITDFGLVKVLSREPFLQKLQLQACVSLSDRCIPHDFADTCPRLERFTVRDCFLTAQLKREFKERRPSVDLEGGIYSPRNSRDWTGRDGSRDFIDHQGRYWR